MRLKTIIKAVTASALTLTVLSANAHHIPHAVSLQKLNQIIDQTNFDVEGHCSGTLISKKYRLVMTAHHCIDNKIRWVEKAYVEEGEVKKKKVEIKKDVRLRQFSYDTNGEKVGGATYQAKIVDYSDVQKGNDLALLQIKAKTVPMTEEVVIQPYNVQALRGEDVYVIGNPANLEGSVTKGIVVSVNRTFPGVYGENLKLIQTDAGVFFGNSGGVLMSANGHYLGTLSRMIPGTSVAFAIHHSKVQDLLEKNCYKELFDPNSETYDECVNNKEEKKEEKAETVKSLLKKLVTEKQAPSAEKEPATEVEEVAP